MTDIWHVQADISLACALLCSGRRHRRFRGSANSGVELGPRPDFHLPNQRRDDSHHLFLALHHRKNQPILNPP